MAPARSATEVPLLQEHDHDRHQGREQSGVDRGRDRVGEEHHEEPAKVEPGEAEQVDEVVCEDGGRHETEVEWRSVQRQLARELARLPSHNCLRQCVHAEGLGNQEVLQQPEEDSDQRSRDWPSA